MARESGANPELVVRDAIPAHLEELHRERTKLITRLLQLNTRIAVCETLAQIAPQPEQPENDQP